MPFQHFPAESGCSLKYGLAQQRGAHAERAQGLRLQGQGAISRFDRHHQSHTKHLLLLLF